VREFSGILHLTYPDNPYTLYMIKSPDQYDKSIYIGVTADHLQRAYKHSRDRFHKDRKNKPLYKWMNDLIENKGCKVHFKVLEENLSEFEAFLKEEELISFCKEEGFNVLNISEGGKGNKGMQPWNKGIVMPEWIVEKFRAANKGNAPFRGKFHKDETEKLISLRNQERKLRGWVNPKKKKIYQYDSELKLINIHNSSEEAATSIGSKDKTSIGRRAKSENLTPLRGYIWSYKLLN
jgi:hypothetical protein